MPTSQDMANQRERLAQHRQNVQTLLQQITAHGGYIHVPLVMLNTLREQRAEIARCKTILRFWGQAIEDHPEDETAGSIGVLKREISELEEARTVALPMVARQVLEQALLSAEERRVALEPVQATVNIAGEAKVSLAIGDNFGVVVQQFFGHRPPEDGATLLRDYLDALSKECDYLRLSRLTGKRQMGGEQGMAPKLRLQAVYTSLTTDGPEVVVHRRERTAAQLVRLLKRLDEERLPDDVPPEQVRVIKVTISNELPMSSRQYRSDIIDYATLKQSPPDSPCTLQISRPELALEAIARHRRLVLLGEPGAGKSTVLRYLTLLLAQRLCGGSAPLPGWPVDDLPIPILCPLGRVAAALPVHNGNADEALEQVLEELLEGEQSQSADLHKHLQVAFRGEGMLLLFDGLDELPAEAIEGGVSPRVVVAEAIRRLGRWTRARIVVTSRVLPYRAADKWQLPAEEGWEVRTIAPLAFGQVRIFVQSWYTALADTDADLGVEEAQVRTAALIHDLEESATVRPLVASPLLLTMLAILHYNKDEVPRDRAKLYEESVQLLLERWESVRTPGLKRPSLLERLGNVPGLELDLLRGVLHELAFEAHSNPPGDDGRGVVGGNELYGRMHKLLRAVRSSDPSHAVQIFEQVLREDAGLLQARDDGHYVFPHLTFQEYLAACHLADQPKMIELVQERWYNPDAERWREVLRLLVGRLRQQSKLRDKVIPWLLHLITLGVGKQLKPASQRWKDVILAILVYDELGEAILVNSSVDVEGQIKEPLRKVLLDLLTDVELVVSPTDRVLAVNMLRRLGW